MSALKRAFSFPVAVSSLLVVVAVATVRSRFDDPDMWWHLKMGEIMWNTHTIPTTDLFSFTTNHHAYISHEWLSQVLIYGAYRLGGYTGLMVWLCFFTSAILVAGYGLCSLYAGNAKVGLVGALTIGLFASIGLAIRPQMIGYLLLTLELLVIQFGRTRSPRWFLALPLLFAIWVNCHGSFFLGIVLAAVISFSSYFQFQWGGLIAHRWERRRRQMLTWSVVLSVPALLLNPAGIRLILYPLETLMVPSISVAAVSEWQPLQFGDLRGLGFMALLGCIFLVVIVRRSELNWDELLLMTLGAWLSASHRRLLFPFGILVAPILTRLLASSWDNYDAEQDRPLPNAVLIVGSLLVVLWAFPNWQNLANQVQENSAVKAVDFIKAQHLAGPMLNDWYDGGYLIWAAPEYPDFIDGRADVFEETGVVADFANWATLQAPPRDLLDKYHINFCLLGRDSPMAVVLPLLPDWKLVYSDARSVVFVRVPAPNPQS